MTPLDPTSGCPISRCLATAVTLGLLAAIAICVAATDDPRQAVVMPAMMKAHLLGNMRDHLMAIAEIQSNLAAGRLDLAGDVAEQRLGMTSLETHGAAHMAAFMPQGMRALGTAMHHAASRFALAAQEAAVTGDLRPALGALAEVTRQCVGCHDGYRLAPGP